MEDSACPEPVARVARLMHSYPATWALCGGWAVDAWLGRQTRDHIDVDLAVFEDEQRAVLDHFAGWRLVGHDDAVPGDDSGLWQGRRLSVPAHIHARTDDFDLDFQLNERSGAEWILSREPYVGLPLSRCVEESLWGVPATGAEVTLYYKAVPPAYRGVRPVIRPQDELDFAAMLPHLSPTQRGWLGEAIAATAPAHPWMRRLAP